MAVFRIRVPLHLRTWLNYPARGTPRTRDGKPNLTAPAPRASDGKPDLSGVWQTELVNPSDSVLGESFPFAVPGDDPRTFSKYFWNILADFKPEEAPMLPEAAELFRKNRATAITPGTNCLPLSMPAADLLAYSPFKIIQTRGVTMVLYEIDNTHRQIYTDGRKLPVDPNPTWMGYSVGRWTGDTFVVDSAGFNDRGRLDGFGHPRSEALHLQERFHRRDFGHMDASWQGTLRVTQVCERQACLRRLRSRHRRFLVLWRARSDEKPCVLQR